MQMLIGSVSEMDWKGHTLSIDPQERAGGLPFGKYSAAKEPLSGTIVLDTARDAVIR
jgi:hypothetical protein